MAKRGRLRKTVVARTPKLAIVREPAMGKSPVGLTGSKMKDVSNLELVDVIIGIEVEDFVPGVDPLKIGEGLGSQSLQDVKPYLKAVNGSTDQGRPNLLNLDRNALPCPLKTMEINASLRGGLLVNMGILEQWRIVGVNSALNEQMW
ncbi:hypothetical protein Dimus_009208 [Dionaea muscipula]